MKIERVSENQLKLTLTRADLSERNLRLEDLITPSAKTQKLFRDIMEQALEEYDFIEENAPIMVEAAPLGMDGIMIIVTKINNQEEEDEHNTHFFPADKIMKKRKSFDVTDKITQKESTTHTKNGAQSMLIYSFAALDDVISVSGELSGFFIGESALYKNEGRFFLVLKETSPCEESTKHLESQLEEYGQKHISTPLAKSYLMEHGEEMVKNEAVYALSIACGV
ncbi:adaptor protein MecA [Chakrabartyella piscis]|uniref:adaptor protein MecA n=1 Tax=Chakrabartyella piscis TaxID=2918914 RepID=UPI0029584D10|nr:adaptor protein MecA [Chakrabartyella piscis]